MVASTPVQRFEPLKDDITAFDRLMFACRKFFREKLLRRRDPPAHRSPPPVVKRGRRGSVGPDGSIASGSAGGLSISPPPLGNPLTSSYPRRSSIVSLDGNGEDRPSRLNQRRASRVSFSDCVDVGETYDPQVYDRAAVKTEMTETDMLRIQAELFLFKMQEMEAVPTPFTDF